MKKKIGTDPQSAKEAPKKVRTPKIASKKVVAAKAEDKVGKPSRMLTGQVISDKMDKTVVVRVERSYMHPRLKKVMRTSKKYKVHDDLESASIGDIVEIYQGRPLSKTKYMYLARIVRAHS